MTKILFFDIDGTLCMPGEAPTERTVSSIRGARANGHKCILSTGRNVTSIPREVAAIGFDGYITNAGASAAVGEERLLSIPIPENVLRETVDILRQNDACFALQTDLGNFSDFAQVDRVWPERPPQVQRYVELSAKMLDVWDLSEMPEVPVYKICFYTPEERHLHALREKLGKWYSFTLFDNLFDDFTIISGELNQHGADKGRALEAICTHFCRSPADAIAFGDSTNDTEMLAAAGLGVAMGNGQASVKAMADRICPPCREDGVAQILEELRLV